MDERPQIHRTAPLAVQVTQLGERFGGRVPSGALELVANEGDPDDLRVELLAFFHDALPKWPAETSFYSLADFRDDMDEWLDGVLAGHDLTDAELACCLRTYLDAWRRIPPEGGDVRPRRIG